MPLDSSYLSLPSVFYKKIAPTAVSDPSLLLFNDDLAYELDLNVDALKINGNHYFSGNALFENAQPFAQAYAGHQFGHFNLLGDGRAVMLGEYVLPHHQRVDIQLKGAGRTPYSRSGDGRAALGPMLREYIVSEAMHGLGIATTRSLAVTTTGEYLYRDEVSPGAVLTRVAGSHIRVGTFQFAAALQEVPHLKALSDYTVARHFPACMTAENPYIALLDSVIALQANLISKWMQVGFIHGVMNTDNMSICGETIDYGPCAFMNAYNSNTVFSSIDKAGRYAFGNQPNIAHWNLTRFAEALLPLLNLEQDVAIAVATQSLDAFPKLFFASWLDGMRKKLGLFNEEADDIKLIEDLLMHMQKNKADYTNTFVALSDDKIDACAIFQDAGFKHWHTLWQARLERQPETDADRIALMHRVNPKVIARNHIVEEALNAAVANGDMTLVRRLLNVLKTPYDAFTGDSIYTQPPPAMFDAEYKTFCGT